jgi:hypothetical protein
MGVACLGADGEEVVDPSGGRLDAIADVERMFRGRRTSVGGGAGDCEFGCGRGVSDFEIRPLLVGCREPGFGVGEGFGAEGEGSF